VLQRETHGFEELFVGLVLGHEVAQFAAGYVAHAVRNRSPAMCVCACSTSACVAMSRLRPRATRKRARVNDCETAAQLRLRRAGAFRYGRKLTDLGREQRHDAIFSPQLRLRKTIAAVE
jgi:hypothetical protein